MRIPQAREVDRALHGVSRALKGSLKGLNEAAGQLMAKGDYEGAQALASKGRAMVQFQAELDALRAKWRELRGFGEDGRLVGTRTPQWQYYQPILQALIELGGEAPRVELEPVVERLMAGVLQARDRAPNARGHQRWQVMIRRAHKHLVAEGWLDPRGGRAWRITDAGREAAKGAAGKKGSGRGQEA